MALRKQRGLELVREKRRAGLRRDYDSVKGESMSEIATDEQIARWKQLAEKATEGPWFVTNPDDDDCMNAFVITPIQTNDDLENSENNIAITLLQAPRYADNEKYLENAAFIAASRTAVPDLIARIESDAAKLAALVGALNEYGKHKQLCSKGITSKVCDCGLDDAPEQSLESVERVKLGEALIEWAATRPTHTDREMGSEVCNICGYHLPRHAVECAYIRARDLLK